MWFNTRTAELVVEEFEILEVREVADGRRDGACARAREFLCLSGSTHSGNSSRRGPTLEAARPHPKVLPVFEIANRCRQVACI